MWELYNGLADGAGGSHEVGVDGDVHILYDSQASSIASRLRKCLEISTRVFFLVKLRFSGPIRVRHSFLYGR